MSSEGNIGFIRGVFAVLGALAAIFAIYEFFIKPQSPLIATEPTAAIQQATQAPNIVAPTEALEELTGKFPCPLLIRQSEVEAWKIGQSTVSSVQDAIAQFDARRPDDAGAFVKGTKIPSGVLVATNFDEQDANKWTQYPVIQIIHSGSWGLFQTTGEYIAPNAGACMTIVP